MRSRSNVSTNILRRRGSALDRSGRLRRDGTSARARLRGARAGCGPGFELAAVCDPRLAAAEETADIVESSSGRAGGVLRPRGADRERRRRGARCRDGPIGPPPGRRAGARRRPARHLREAARDHRQGLPGDPRGRRRGRARCWPRPRTTAGTGRTVSPAPCSSRAARRGAPHDRDERRRRRLAW